MLEILRGIRDQCDAIEHVDDEDLAVVRVASLLNSGFNSDLRGRPQIHDSIQYTLSIQDATLNMHNATSDYKIMGGWW